MSLAVINGDGQWFAGAVESAVPKKKPANAGAAIDGFFEDHAHENLGTFHAYPVSSQERVFSNDT